MYYLKKPDLSDRDEFIDMMNEWEMTDESIVPSIMCWYSPHFETFLSILKQYENAETTPAQLAPASLYILTDETGRIYGGFHIRHYLTTELRLFGGHIGYGIRPSERNKGLGKLQLALGLDVARQMGFEKVMVSCDAKNKASDAVIKSCGGELEFEGVSELHPNVRLKRYWITL